jgi:arylsulfatase A-like enzyme
VRRIVNLALVATWSALLTGCAELVIRGVEKFVLGRYIYMSRDIFWMTPSADLLLFGAVALVLAVLSLAAPRLASFRVAGGVFAFLGALSILAMQPWIAWWAMLALATGVAYQAGSLAAAREARARRIMRLSLPVLAVTVAVLGVGRRVVAWRAEHRAIPSLSAARPDAPSVLLIVWDAVRAQSVGLYGYARPTTPTLTAFAAGGVVFDQAIATAPYTLPTHASLFTGLWAHQFTASWEIPLDGSMPTLAEALGRRGYRTGAFSANHIFVTWEHGLLRGFAHGEDYVFSRGELARSSALIKWLLSFVRLRVPIGWYDNPGRRRASNIRTSFLDWLDQDRTRPFFAFLNVFDAHGPYLPPAPYDTLFAPPGTSPAEHDRARRLTRFDPLAATPDDIARRRDLYDGAIASEDHDLGLLLEALAQRGVLRNTLVVIVGDHGEAFGEHRTFTHGNDAYAEVVHVPLVVVWPGAVPAGVRVAGIASLRDVPATIAELIGVAGASWPLPGTSLSRFWRPISAASIRSDTVLTEVDFLARGEKEWYPVRRGPVRSILAWPWQLILSADSTELYDMAADPGERIDLARRPEHRATRDALVGALLRMRQGAVHGKQ